MSYLPTYTDMMMPDWNVNRAAPEEEQEPVDTVTPEVQQFTGRASLYENRATTEQNERWGRDYAGGLGHVL